MKRKPEPSDSAELVPEYDFRGGLRGKYAGRYAAIAGIVALLSGLAVLGWLLAR